MLTLTTAALSVLASAAPPQEEATKTPSGVVEFYQSDSEFGNASRIARVYEYLHPKDGRRIEHVGDVGGPGSATLRLQGVAAGEHEYIVIVESTEKLARPAETRSLDRLEPNVKLEAREGHITRVNIGLFGGGLDSQRSRFRENSGLARGGSFNKNRVTFDNPVGADTDPTASHFSTDIVVYEPKPMKSNR